MLPTELAVLVVDDDLAIREAIRLVLEDEGYRVLTAQDGMEALGLLRASPCPLVVVLDYIMPQLNGLDVLRTVRADEHLAADHAFVLCTAQGNSLPPELQAVCAQLGAPLLAKPFDLLTLVAVVSQAAQRLAQEPTLPHRVAYASSHWIHDSRGIDDSRGSGTAFA